MTNFANRRLRAGLTAVAVVAAAGTLVWAAGGEERDDPKPAGPAVVEIDAVSEQVGVGIGTSGPGLVIDAKALAPLIAVHVESRDELRACIDAARRAAAAAPGRPAPC